MALSANTARLKRLANRPAGANHLKKSTRLLINSLKHTNALHATSAGGSLRKLKRFRQLQAKAYKNPIGSVPHGKGYRKQTTRDIAKRRIAMERQYLTGK